MFYSFSSMSLSFLTCFITLMMLAQCMVDVAFLFWGVRLDRVDWGKEIRSRHLVLWSRNHEYSTLTWND